MPQIPYYAVIFTSVHSNDVKGYREMDDLTFKEVKRQQGFLGVESYKNEDGKNVTIAYFKTEMDILLWKNNTLHKKAQQMGKEKWYNYYNVKVCKIEREYEFNK